MKFDKRSCLKRAKELLEEGDDSLLRYVCLELRFCMEAVTYQKLETYAKRLPKGILNTWQPPQAVKALLELEPGADQDFQMAVAFESKPGVPTGKWMNLGSHKSLKLAWLRKHYNKLGNLLHVPSPAAEASSLQLNPKDLRQYLASVVAELEPVVASRIDSSIANLVKFKCSVCGEPVMANLEGVLKSHKAVCLNPSCGAEFSAIEGKGGKPGFHLIATKFRCVSCKHETPVENRKLRIGARFKCEKCGAEHEFAARQWGYGLVSELEAANKAPAADGGSRR
jgi:DNA-directed RNA polymerase subunit RPC12/RpoP